MLLAWGSHFENQLSKERAKLPLRGIRKCMCIANVPGPLKPVTVICKEASEVLKGSPHL